MLAFLAAALLLQDSAADFYKKVEEKYASAKSLSLTTQVEVLSVKDGKETVVRRMEGSLQSEGEGRLHVGYSLELDGKPAKIATIISDGKTLSMQHISRPTERKEHALALGTWTRRFGARLGITSSMAAAFGAVSQSDELKLEKLFVVSEAADGGREKVGDVECRIVTYTVSQFPEGARPLKCRAWIDPVKLVVLKHEVADRSTVIRETHSNVTFDSDIPDDQFKIP